MLSNAYVLAFQTFGMNENSYRSVVCTKLTIIFTHLQKNALANYPQ